MTVGPALQVAIHDNVFAIGDVSTADAKMAGMASMQRTRRANIIKMVNGDNDLTLYEPYGHAIVVPIGPDGGAANSPAKTSSSRGDGRQPQRPRPDGRPLRRDLRHTDLSFQPIDSELTPMPAITVDDTLVLPHVPRPDPTTSTPGPVARSSPRTANSRAPASAFGDPSRVSWH